MNIHKKQAEYFDKNWFDRHQGKLMWLTNTPVISYFWRKALNITKKGKLSRVEPNSIVYDAKEINGRITATEDFIGVNKYSRKIYNLAPTFFSLYISIKQGVTWEKVFDETWFEQFQPTLLHLVNGRMKWLWRRVLRIEKYDTTEDITYIGRHYITWGDTRKGDKVEKQYAIFTYPKYAVKLYKYLYPLWATLHGLDSLFKLTRVNVNFGYDSFSLVPNSDTESNSVDGYVARQGVSEAWATIRGGAGNLASDNGASAGVPQIDGSATTNEWADIFRSIFVYDTSIIGSGRTVTAASLHLYGGSTSDNFSQSVGITDCTTASDTALANADYGNVGFTRQCDTDIAVSAWNTTGYNNYTLNSTGIGNINTTAASKFAQLLDGDIDNSEPTWSSAAAFVTTIYSDNGSNEPKLTLTVTEIFVPDAAPESTSVDGYARELDNAGLDWSVIRGAAGDFASDTGVNIDVVIRADANTDKWDVFNRGIAGFDISAIEDTANVTAATLSLHGTASKFDDFTSAISIVEASPASNTAIVAGDYNSLGTTKFASDIAISSFSTSAYNTFTLNATGLTYLGTKLAGVANLGIAIDQDIDNSEPTWSSGARSQATILMSDNGYNEPLLTVTWSTGPAASRRMVIIT